MPTDMEYPVKVSIITPVFNSEKYLEQAIESVFAQSFTQWEIILIDDGSTDASPDIARKLAGKHHPKVKYFEHEGHINRGVACTRNLGIEAASGSLIAFLDSDDYWDFPDKLKLQVKILDDNPEVGLVYGQMSTFCEENAPPKLLKLANRPIGRGWPGQAKDVFDEITLENMVTTSTAVARKKVLTEWGGFPEELITASDWALWTLVAFRHPFYFLDIPLARYRRHVESLVFSGIQNAEIRFRAAFEYMQAISDRLPAGDPRVEKARQQLKQRLLYMILEKTGGSLFRLKPQDISQYFKLAQEFFPEESFGSLIQLSVRASAKAVGQRLFFWRRGEDDAKI